MKNDCLAFYFSKQYISFSNYFIKNRFFNSVIWLIFYYLFHYFVYINLTFINVKLCYCIFNFVFRTCVRDNVIFEIRKPFKIIDLLIKIPMNLTWKYIERNINLIYAWILYVTNFNINKSCVKFDAFSGRNDSFIFPPKEETQKQTYYLSV